MKNNYTIIIEETVTKEFQISAKNPREAIQLAIKKYNTEEFVLDPGEVQQRRIRVTSKDDDSAMKFIEF